MNTLILLQTIFLKLFHSWTDLCMRWHNSNFCISGVTIQENTWNFDIIFLWPLYLRSLTWFSKKWCQSTKIWCLQLSQLLHVNVCIDVEDIYRILTLHTLIPHLISVFEVWEARWRFCRFRSWTRHFAKIETRSTFNLGGPAPNRRRDGESNDTTLDLVLIPAPS